VDLSKVICQGSFSCSPVAPTKIFPDERCKRYLRKAPEYRLSSIGSSCLSVKFRSPHLKGKFQGINLETAEPSSNHSYEPSIIGQMIMLPSHGQSTAAVEHLNVTGQVRLLIVLPQGAVFLLYRRGSFCRVPS